MPEQQTCGQALVRLLEAYGVDTVFGIPGVHTLDLYRGLAGSDICHVVTRHEQGAGFMADGYARATGRPGVCVLITGPGVTNAATPIGQAFSDSVPMLVISSVNARSELGKGWGRLHEITDQRAVMTPLTGFSATALAPDDVPDLLGRAFGLFSSSRPRPVHIEVPIDVLAAAAGGDWVPRAAAGRPGPAAEAVRAAAGCLAESRRPVIILGGGAIAAGAAAQAIAERLGAALVTTTAAKGAVPDTHPLSLGASLSLAPTLDLIAEADCVLALGTELSETDSWVSHLPMPETLIRVDIDPAKLSDQYPAKVAMVADAAQAASAILEKLAGAAAGTGDRGAVEADLSDRRGRMTRGLPPKTRGHIAVLEAVRRVLPQTGLIVSDMTQIAYSGNVHYPAERPGQWLHPLGYGTLGYGLPAAIGAKLGAPERAVVALAGDGGFMFTVQELSVAVELELSLPILLWNNEAYGQILDGMVERQIPPIGVRPRNPKFQALAAAFECPAEEPSDLAALETVLSAALERKGPTLIELHEEVFVA